MKQYGIDDHRHRFSVWAAARATQRGLTNVVNLRKALEGCGVVAFLACGNLEAVDEAAFENHHRSWCRAIMACLIDLGVPNVTFGRAAKLIAIYLKSIVVLGSGCGSRLSQIAHPPIDGILLANIAVCPSIDSPHKAEWAKVRWTKLDEAPYYRLIGQLRAALVPADAPFWMLEQYWTVTDEEGL
jgi:hypothetical protein